MGVEVGAAINGGAEWACRNGVIKSVIRNPIAVALLLTVLAYIIFSAIWGGPHSWREGLRASLYFFGASAVTVFLHYYASDREALDLRRRELTMQAVEAATGRVGEGRPGYYQVSPGSGPPPPAQREQAGPRPEAQEGERPDSALGIERKTGGNEPWVEPFYLQDKPTLSREACDCGGGDLLENLPPLRQVPYPLQAEGSRPEGAP